MTNKLGELFHLIYQYEKVGLEASTDNCLTPSEMHFVECIGEKKKVTSKDVGESLNITKGAVSQQLSKLIKNKVVMKEVSQEDKRKSYLVLTEKGLACYIEHQAIKTNFNRILTEKLTLEEQVGFVKGLTELNFYLKENINWEKPNER